MPVVSAASARAGAGSMPLHLARRPTRCPPGPTPEEAALGREERQRIWRIFRRLSARQQEVFALRQLEGWSTDEVAETLGLSSGSVKRHLFRATHQLRAALRGTR